MAEQAGKLAQVWIKAATAITSSTGAKIKGVDSETYNKLCQIMEITQLGNTYVNRMAGLKDTSISLSGNHDTADAAGQMLLEPGDSLFVGVYHLGPAAVGLGQAEFIIENFEHKASPSGKQEFSCSLSGKAAPVALPAQA